MALRARLVAPPPERPQNEYLWQTVKWAGLPAHVLWRGDRRLEAENYLSTGYGIRIALEERAVGWKRFGQVARVWQPARTKATLVSPESGTPFLIANQVFSTRPHVRKWLAVEKLSHGESLFVKQGTILVRRSASVGRTVLAYAPHEGILISDHFLRVEPAESENWGWIYACLRSPQARAMMTGAKYGHIINHIEVSHLEALPVPVVRSDVALRFRKQTQEILNLRNRGYHLTLEAEERFERALGSLKVSD
jgi:type I restriction enzyme, S subunit